MVKLNAYPKRREMNAVSYLEPIRRGILKTRVFHPPPPSVSLSISSTIPLELVSE